jgi:hypothetical protein
MSKKFTGVHSGGQNIPVYDKDAHSAIEQKLNTSAFQSVSGNFLTAVPDAYATKEYVAAAASGKLDKDTFAQVSGDFLTAVPQSYLQNTDLTVTSGKVTEISGIPLSAGGTLPDTIPVSGVSGISVTETENQVLIGISADFATSADLESKLADKLDTSAFSSVSGDFLTAVPDDFATKEYLSGQISGKYDTSSFAEVSGNFLTAVPESAISGKQDTLEFGYDGNSAISGINGSALAGGIDPSMLTGYAEYSAISAKLAPEDIAIFTYGKQSAAYPYILSAYAAGKICFAKHEYDKYYYPLVAIQSANPAYGAYSGYNRATFGKWVAGSTSQSVWSGTETNATMNIYFVDGASDKSGSDGWSYGWTQNTFIPQKYGDYYSASNPSGFLTEIPQSALSGYAEYSAISGKIAPSGFAFFTAYRNLFADVSAAVAEGKICYAKYTEQSNIYMPLVYYENGDGYYRQHLAVFGTLTCPYDTWDISGSKKPGWTFYSVNGDLDPTVTNSGWHSQNRSFVFEEDLSGYMQTSGLEYDGDKISGYMGSAFKAGDELPSGVMVESAVEYNAVNEISGYNGSAIAQYGAEKQWLVHDDTLVHASNSAQYALGVNVSAVQTLMGLDETVLFSGSESVSSCTLSEPWTAFDRLRLYVQNHAADGGVDVVELRPTSNGMYNYCGNWSWSDSDMLWVTVHGSATDTTLTNTKSWGFKNNFTATAPTVRNNNNNDMQSILKVVGVGKKEV